MKSLLNLKENLGYLWSDLMQMIASRQIYTIKNGVTIFVSFFCVLILLFDITYFIFGEYISAGVSTFSLLLTVYLMLYLYRSPSFSKILISWFYAYIVILIIVMNLLYGWQSGGGLYLIILMSFNYFLSINNKLRVILLAFAEIIFFVPFLYLTLTYLPNGFLSGTELFVSVLYVLVCGSIITGMILCVGLYSVVVSNSIKRLEGENEELANRARYDYLTGLLNRHTMEELIQLENLQKRDVNSFALIIGDVDHFKKVNDTYTHACGDMVLKQVAKSLAKTFRAADKVCRWGGEEFMVFCENVTFEHANILLERTRKNISAQTLEYNNHKISVSMTFGAVFCNSLEGYNKAALIKQADMLMFKGKNAGRNRVVMQRATL